MEAQQPNLGLEQLIGILRRRAIWVLLAVLALAVLAFAYSKHEVKKYTATAAVAFNTNPLSQQIAGLSTSTGSSNLVAQQDSNLELVKLGKTGAKTAEQLGHGLTDEKVSDSVSVGVKGETNIIDVSATSISPTLAAAIANTYAGQFVKEQQAANHEFFKSALELVDRQLAKLPKAQRFGPDGLQLEERAHTLGLLSELGYNNAQIAGEALVPSSPSSPKTKRNTLLGALLGLVVGLGLAFLLERLDRRVREPEDLGAIYRLPMLGVVPKSAALSRPTRPNGGGTALPPMEAEAFSLIRAHLRFFNIDREVRTIVIASPSPGDGKTTIARHLAEAAARLGSRVLLMEVDLRHPTIAQHLGVRAGMGLAGTLIGDTSMAAAIETVELQVSPGEGVTGRTLDVLLAGEVLPPNPGELIASRAMDAVLAQAKSIYDLVVLDTPPLTAVSDAFPLLTKVDGVVVVGWVGQSRRDAAGKLHQILAASDAPLLGVIANGSKAGGPAPYPGGYSQGPPTDAPASSAESAPEEFVSTSKT